MKVGAAMLVKCIESFQQQIIEGEIYLVLEIYGAFEAREANYRIIDSDGYPAIYPAANFSIVSGRLDGLNFFKGGTKAVISHSLIQKSILNEEHKEGFWGLFFDEDNEMAREILQEVVVDLARAENIDPPVVRLDD